MRVCKVWDSDYPWDVRVEKVAHSLTAAGHEVHLVARNRDRRPEHERLAEAEVHRLKPWKFLGSRLDRAAMFPAFINPRWLTAILRTARDSAADVLLVRDLPLAPAAVWVARWLGIPVVLDMAENYPAMLRGIWEAGVQRRMDIVVRNPRLAAGVERWVLQRIDHALVVVEESRDRLVAMGLDRRRISVVGNTPSRARLEGRAAKVHRDGTSLELIYLGLLEAPRGLAVLIDAVATARQVGVDARLTVLGDGRERRNFEEQARARGLAADEVRFAGRLPYAEALVRLESADVGVVPHVANESWNSTIPNKLFDYMATGLAVLTSTAKPAARVVRESGAGLVFEAGDAADCARAIQRLAAAEFRSACGANGRRAIATEYHWERDAERMLAAMEQVTASGTR